MQPHPYPRPDRPGGPLQPTLTRYRSAPAGSAYLSAIVDSVVAGSAVSAEFHGTGAAGSNHLLQTSSGHGSSTGGGFFPAEQPSFRSPGTIDPPPAPAPAPLSYDPLDDLEAHHISVVSDLGGPGAAAGAGPAHQSSLLFRHNSSPAGILHRLMVDEHGLSVTGAGGGLATYPHLPEGLQFQGGRGKLRSQRSYPSRQDSLSSISEISMPNVASNPHVVSGFQDGGSWDEGGAMGFRGTSDGGIDRQLRRDGSEDFMSALDDMDSPVRNCCLSKVQTLRSCLASAAIFSSQGFQPPSHSVVLCMQFNLPGPSLEMAAMEQLLQIQQDTVACKVRARRGCATHPRSIAERARRTKISEKLKKLQELVPNMDKQTNTADMLDLAVRHIKCLQSQVQKLNDEQSNCICSQRGAFN